MESKFYCFQGARFLILDLEHDLAAYPTIRAGGLDSFHLPRATLPNGDFRPKGCRGTHLDAAATKLASAIYHVAVSAKTDIGTKTTIEHTDRFYPIDFTACPYASPAQDAFIAVNLDERVGIVDRIMVFCSLETIPFNPIFISKILQ